MEKRESSNGRKSHSKKRLQRKRTSSPEKGDVQKKEIFELKRDLRSDNYTRFYLINGLDPQYDKIRDQLHQRHVLEFTNRFKESKSAEDSFAVLLKFLQSHPESIDSDWVRNEIKKRRLDGSPRAIKELKTILAKYAWIGSGRRPGYSETISTIERDMSLFKAFVNRRSEGVRYKDAIRELMESADPPLSRENVKKLLKQTLNAVADGFLIHAMQTHDEETFRQSGILDSESSIQDRAFALHDLSFRPLLKHEKLTRIGFAFLDTCLTHLRKYESEEG